MKTFLIILCLLLSIFGCSNPEPPTHEKLSGNWVSTPSLGCGLSSPSIFTFQDTTCSYLNAFGEFTRYWLKGDTLLIREMTTHARNSTFGGKIMFKFLIVSLSSDTLTLLPASKETQTLIQPHPGASIQPEKFRKITTDFDWNIGRIAFYSSQCYGTCPSMYLEIDTIGTLLFHGRHFTEKEGFFRGEISAKEFQSLKSLIDQVPLDSLKNYYDAPWTDDQTCGIRIEKEGKMIESNVYGFDAEPVEFRILIHRLQELYKKVVLEPDSTVQEQFAFQDFRGYPKPPKSDIQFKVPNPEEEE